MSCFNRNIIRDGTSQMQRYLPALDPESFQLLPESMEDLLRFTARFAKLIVYYNEQNEPDGDWSAFFQEDELLKIARNIDTRNDLEPHLALFFAFLKLYEYLQNDLNGLTKRYLDYYYREVLQFKPKPPEADRVHVVFELAKQVKQHRLKAGTKLSAGKDDNGNEQLYALERDFILNQAKIASLRSLFVDRTLNYRPYIAPVANSRDGRGKEIIDKNQGWLPFGKPQRNLPQRERTMIDGEMGFAIASPVFVFEEGFNEIKIEITFAESLFYGNISRSAFKAYLSGEEGWVELTADAELDPKRVLVRQDSSDPGSPLVEEPAERRLTLIITSADALIIQGFDAENFEKPFNTSHPVLKLVLNSTGPFAYNPLKDYQVESIDITVEVNDLTKLSVSTDQGIVDPSKPFQPFGAIPKIGSAFDVKANELDNKKVTNGTLKVTWNDRPSDIRGKYYNYYVKKATGDFAINDELGIDFRASDKSILDGNEDTFSLSAGINPTISVALEETQFTQPADPSVKFKTFGHDEFPSRYSEVAIGKAAKPAEFENIEFPNPPYTPIIKGIKLTYTAKEKIDFNQSDTASFYHIEPFGIRPITDQSSSLIPLIEQVGYLYIGLQDFKPPQQISILFQVLEGSGQLTNEEGELITPLESEDITWSYLGADEWIDLSSPEVLAENTRGLQGSGIVELAIGEDASDTNPRMPKGLHWIRAGVREKPQTAGRLIELLPQAALVKYQFPEPDKNDNNSPAPAQARQLSPESIKKLERPDKAVKKIKQPYPSFGGRGTENEQAFYTRVSERLRHKKRAVTLWDYERLVLEEFPSVFKVKCLNHTNPQSEPAPGEVTLVVVPNPRIQNTGKILQPQVNINQLRAIADYVQQFAPSYVQIHTTNPVYEPVFLDFKVGFRSGFDPGFYAGELNEAIKRFLSPWAFEEGEDIVFGGKIYKAAILAFIEQRNYVDYVTDFEMYHAREGEPDCPGIGEMRIRPSGAREKFSDFVVQKSGNNRQIGDMIIKDTLIIGKPVEVAASVDPMAIIVSAPEHSIRILKPDSYECLGSPSLGIGSMRILVDFTINESKN